MSLELSSIAFKVETKELDVAVQKLGDLQKAVTNLNKPIASTTLATEKLAQAQAKTAKEQAKAEEAANKAAAAQVKLEKATTAVSRTASSNTSILERQQKILEFMTQGMSKGQASILATAHATGILDEESKKLISTLDSQRKLLGSEPFDKSLGAIKVMKNELGALRESQRQYNSGVELTVKQSKDLYREKFRLIEAMKIERDRAKELGDSTVSESERYKKLKQDLRSINSEYVALAKQRNSLSDDASSQELKRKMNNLSRGLAPQISDVAVSLYGGMSPMTVLMQQGLQVRDLIQSSGVEAGKLNEVLKTTGKDFLGTLTGTFKAVGALTVGVFQAAGQSVLDFTMKLVPADFITRKFSESLVTLGFSAEKVESSVGSFGRLMSGMFGAALALAAATVIGIVVAFKQLSDEQSALAKTTAQFGGVLGLTAVDAKTLTDSVSVLGVSSSKATSILAEMGKAGNLGSESFKAIATSAVDAQKYVGISVETTVKNFSDLLKDPVKVLTKFGIETGYVNAEQIKLVETLLKSGQTSEANAKAVELLQNAYVKMSAEAKGSLSGLDLALIAISSSTGTAWDTFKNSDAVITSLNAVAAVIKTVADGAAFLALGVKTIATVAAAVNAPEGVSDGAAFDTMKSQLQDYVNEYQNYRKELWEGSKQTSQISSEEKKATSEKVAATEAQRKLEKALGLETKDRIKELARAQYITLSVEKERIAAGKGAIVTMDLMKDAAKKYGEEWDKAHKQRPKKEDTAGVAAMWEKVSSAVNKASQSYDEVVNGVQVYTNAQKIMIDLLDDPAFLKQPETLQKEALARLAVAHATEQQTQEVKDLWETEKRRILSTFQSEAEVDALRIAREQRGDSEIINAQNKLELLDEELADMLLQKAIYGELTVEQKKQLEYAKIQKDYKAEELRITKLLADPKSGVDEMAALLLRNINYEAAAKKRQNIDQAIILENNKYEYEQRVQLAAGISSSIETALFEGGQAGSKKLRDVIEAELRKPITLFIQAVVQDIFGLNGAGDTMSKAVSAFDKVSSFFSSGGTNNLVSSGLTKLISSEVGYKLGLANPAGYTTGSGVSYSANSTGSMLSKTAGQVGGAMTAYGIQKGLSGGYKTGESGAVDALTAIGGFFDPTGGLIAGTIGAAVNRAFGRKLTETGIEGTFGGSQGFTGNQYSFEKGGWFRSDRTKTSALDSGIQEGLAGQFNVLRAGIALMSTSLGLGTKSIEDFSYKFKLNLMGLSEADATKKIKEEFDKVGLAIADTIPELNEYQRQGETNLDTLTRLSTSLGAVNSTFELLGFKLENLSLSGAKAADAIITAYGSLETFSSKMQAYYDAFYTEEEKKANVLQGISTALKAASVDIGDVSVLTRESFKNIVDQLVETKGAADPAVVALLSVAPALASVTKSTDELVEAARKAAEDAAEIAAKALEAEVKRQKELSDVAEKAEKAANEAQSTVEKTMQEFDKKVKSFFDNFRDSLSDVSDVINSASNSINNFIADLISQVKGNNGLIQVRQEFERNLSKAQDGDRDALNNITGSAGSLIESIRSNASSAAEAALGQARVVQQLLKLPSQVKPEDLIVNAIQKQTFELATSISKDFISLDKNVDGLLTFDELKLAGIATDGQLGNLIAAADSNADGNISAIEAMTATLSARFASIDVNVSGTIDYNEFRNTFAGLGSEATLRSIFSELDVNGDGTISRLEAIKGTSADTADNTYGLDKLSRIKDVVNALNWGTSEFDAASLKALSTVAGQQNWSAKDISDALGRFTAEEIVTFFNKYGYSIGSGTIGSGASNQPVSPITTSPLSKPSFSIGGTTTSSNGISFVDTNSKLGNTYYGTGGTAIYDPYYVDRFDSINSYVNTLDWGAGKDESITSLVANAQQYGVSANEIAIATGYSRDDIIALTGGQIPAFANGGFHAGGLRLVGEQGPEVELTGPSRIISNSKLSSMLNQDSSEVVTAINELNSNVNLLRYEMQATAVNTGKTERILNRVTNYGESMQVTTTV